MLGYDKHTELQTYVKTLNASYKEHPAFWQVDYSWEGFQWIVPDDSQQSVIAFLRKDAAGKPDPCHLQLQPRPARGLHPRCTGVRHL